MNSPAYIIAKYLESLGVGTVGTDIFSGKEPETAGTIATIYDTGGRDPLHNLCADPDQNTWQPSVQLRVRADSYPTAFARISALRRSILMLTGYATTEVVAGVQTTDSILDTVARSDIISIGEDANNRAVLTANFDLLSSSRQFIVDKSALQSALAAAGALTEADYTPASWAVLADAVTSGQGVYDDPSATQEQVDDATQAITSAIDGLVQVPVGCTSCLGKWTNETATMFGYSPATVSGVCGHHVSVADADVNSGLYIASIPLASAFSLTWPDSELRIFAADMTKLQAVSGSNHTVDSADLVIYDMSDGHQSVMNSYATTGSSITRIRMVAQDAMNTPVSSPVEVGSSSSIVAIGITGDGRCVVFGGNASVDGYEIVSSFKHNPAHSFALAIANAVGDIGNYTSGFEADILMDAAALSDAISLPDMSADGITAVKDFCGNVVS